MKTLEKTLEILTKLVELGGFNREREGSRRSEQENRKREDSEQGGRRKEAKEQYDKIECRDQKKPGGCTWGSACRYLHIEGVGRVEQVKLIDCTHWMEGYCMFEDNRCKNIHNANKKGTKKKASRQDFSEALAMVKEVRDAVAGGAINKQDGGQGGQQHMMMPSSQQQMLMNKQHMMNQQQLQMMMPQNMIQHMNPMAQMNPVNQMMMTPMMMMQPSMQMQQQGLGGGQGHFPSTRQ